MTIFAFFRETTLNEIKRRKTNYLIPLKWKTMAFSHVRSFYRVAIVNKFAETRCAIKSRDASTVDNT